jgi:hypothetical protein
MLSTRLEACFSKKAALSNLYGFFICSSSGESERIIFVDFFLDALWFGSPCLLEEDRDDLDSSIFLFDFLPTQPTLRSYWRE